VIVVVKFGGELLERSDALHRAAEAVRSFFGDAVSDRGEDNRPRVVIAHGGGREIDAALAAAGIEKRQVDGLRITDAATLDVVVGVLAGRINTRFVAALTAAGVPAVGLTGADARCGVSRVSAPHRSVDGRMVDLGLVGEPIGAERSALLDTLLDAGFVPVVASIGATTDGQLLNVNADTLAAHLALSLRADRLVLAGGTDGVLDSQKRSIAVLDRNALDGLVATATATAGMIAKLRAVAAAIDGGVPDVRIVNGHDGGALAAVVRGAPSPRSTQVVSAAAAQVS